MLYGSGIQIKLLKINPQFAYWQAVCLLKLDKYINHSLHKVPYMASSGKISISIEEGKKSMEGIIKKKSCERRDYESVADESLSYSMSRKTMKTDFRQ